MSSDWKITEIGKVPELKDPILIVGLPGIGNVGKVAVDFLVEELKAKRTASYFSYSFPHSVFVNEKNLVELPTIELYYKKVEKGKHDILLLMGDIQPSDEPSCYHFCELLLDQVHKLGCKEIITLGGIGLQEVPKKPKVYCTGNNKELIDEYKKNNKELNNNIYGVVGPIIGVSGIVVGLANPKKIKAITLLAETYAHPMYLGVTGAREIIKIISIQLKLNIDIKKMDKEIKSIEEELMKRTNDLSDVSAKTALNKMSGKLHQDVNYIG